MSKEKYCEPCRRLLRGELAVHFDDRLWRVQFDHHLDYGSFERAMQLPCSICTLAWANHENLPNENRWGKLVGEYSYYLEDGRMLFFFADRNDHQTWSSQLYLEDLSNLTKGSICHVLPPNTREALHFLVEQYHDCCARHAQCSSNLESPQSDRYPLRLLDVGTGGSPVILRSTRMFSNQEYICLSHCWGDSKPYTLTSITQRDLEWGIRPEILPRTFQDAIYVTRCLDIQYLWIDSICIFQDSESDWATESTRMDQIYARAACTIAATASIDSNGGLFFERYSEPLLPRFLDFHFDFDASWLKDKDKEFQLNGSYVCDIKHMSQHCIENAPLNSRAWVSQERQLSRRVMHFSNRQLFWECHENTTCETYPNGVPKGALPVWHKDATMLKRRLHQFKQHDNTFSDGSKISLLSEPGLNHELYWAWCSFRVHYSQSALTRASDKLVALRGIAKHVSEVTGDELIAGLWKTRMIEELCWFKRLWSNMNPPAQPTEWRAPTWSWVASNDMIWISTMSKFHQWHESRYFEAEVIDIDIGTKLSGELTHGSMKIKCKPMLATIIPDDYMPGPRYELEGHLELIEEDMHPLNTALHEEGIRVRSELLMDDPNFCDSQQVYIVLIQRCLHENTLQDDDKNSTEDCDKSCTLSDPQDSVLRMDQKSVQSQEVLSKDKEPWDADMLEGLLLQKNDKHPTAFSRIGLFRLQGWNEVRPILNAHLKRACRTITLI